MATLALAGVTKSFGATQVLHGIDLEVADGEMVVLVGASGCGKSTLLRIVAGLEAATTGSVRIDGADVSAREPADRDIAMMFQTYALYPHMTVRQNMAYGLRIRGMAKPDITTRVADTAALLGLDGLLDRKPRELSGGQRQRVAMGRAIVREPKLFLFDEPLSNLDAKLRVTMRGEIRRLQRRLGTTSLFVTHDQVEAMTLGDRLVVMHEGRAAQVATPMQIWSRPADTYVATFIGSPSMNLLRAHGAEGGAAAVLACGVTARFTDGPRALPDGTPLTIGIRPEHVVADPGGLALTIDLTEPLGAETVTHGRLPNGEALGVKLPTGMAADRVALPPAAWHVFDASGRRVEPG